LKIGEFLKLSDNSLCQVFRIVKHVGKQYYDYETIHSSEIDTSINLFVNYLKKLDENQEAYIYDLRRIGENLSVAIIQDVVHPCIEKGIVLLRERRDNLLIGEKYSS